MIAEYFIILVLYITPAAPELWIVDKATSEVNCKTMAKTYNLDYEPLGAKFKCAISYTRQTI